MNTTDLSAAEDGLIPSSFLRHRRQLRALLIEEQPWFVVHDLAKLLNRPITEHTVHKLDADQYRREPLAGEHGQELLVSESGVYALLMIYYYHPENRGLRQWLSNEVVPVLRDERKLDLRLPRRRMEQVQGQPLSVLDWQGRLWVRWGDAVRLMEEEARACR